MTVESFNKGDLIRCSAVYTDDAGVEIDPAGVFFRVAAPDGTQTPYTYGVDAELVRDSQGNYHLDVDGDSSGLWTVKFFSTGSGQAASPDVSFWIGRSTF